MFRRRIVASIAAAAAALVGATALPASAVESTYTFAKRFTASYSANQQGLAYANGLHYVSYDTGGGYGRIVAYDSTGKEVKRSPSLRIGHASEISYRKADGNFYVAVYADGTPGLKVAVVDMRPATPVMLRTIDFSQLGDRGMVAVDNARDQIVLKSGPRDGPHVFSTADMQGNILSSFKDASQGLGQGLELVGNDLLLFTSAADLKSNKITVYDRRTGVRRARTTVPVSGEGEGLSVNHSTGQVYIGHYNHSIYSMSPVYSPNRLVNPGAESASGGSGHPQLVALEGWTVSGGMTSIRYGASAGYPSSSSPGPVERGRAFFSGNTSATATATQIVSVSDKSSAIDAGASTYVLSGWLGGYKSQTDAAKVNAVFRSSTGATLGSAVIGPVTPSNRAGVTGLLLRSATGKVPAGTRSVQVIVTASRGGGTNNDGYSDSLSFVVR